MTKDKFYKIASIILVCITGLFWILWTFSFIYELFFDKTEMHYGDALGCWYYNSKTLYFSYFAFWTILQTCILYFEIRSLIKLNFKKAFYTGLIFIITILAHLVIAGQTCDSNI
jgi:hypothetical protein